MVKFFFEENGVGRVVCDRRHAEVFQAWEVVAKEEVRVGDC